MEYQDINSTLLERSEKDYFKHFLTKRKYVVVGVIVLTTIFIVSIGFNIRFLTMRCQLVKGNNDDLRIQIHPKELKQKLENETIIECQREFFLFHQDQNHVCEVTGLFIKNETNVTIIGNNITNVLYIFSFQVYKLPKEIFRKFINLKFLIVNGNHLQILEDDTFEFAGNLEVLRLSNNDLSELRPSTFHYMHNLKTLDLGRNKIESIQSKCFQGLDNLERLYLSDNIIKSLPIDTFLPLRKLISLSLENNQISDLHSKTFENNRLIRSIGLSNNTFKTLQKELFQYFENLTDLSLSELRIKNLDLNGTTVSTLVIRNTDLLSITLSNYPKILVSYGTNIEFIQFIINNTTADFKKIPNWGGMFYNKNIRFLFYFKKEIATRENIESYDGVIRTHIFLPSLDYRMADGSQYLAVEYTVRNN